MAVALATTLFLIIRPLLVFAGLAAVRGSAVRRWLAGWFGVRGVASLYYLTRATGHGLSDHLFRPLADLVVWTVALSVVAHGMSVTPVMNWYTLWAERRQRR